MIFLQIFAILPSLVRAVALDRRADTQTVQLQWHFDKNTENGALAIMDPSRTKILAHSCNNTLTVESSSEVILISIDVDERADGNVHVGNQTYLVHSLPEFSGGITCTSYYTQSGQSFVDCGIPLPNDVKFEEISAMEADDCFSNTDMSQRFDLLFGVPAAAGIIGRRGLAKRAMEYMDPNVTEVDNVPSTEIKPRCTEEDIKLGKRQCEPDPCLTWGYRNELSSNPVVAQDHILKQLSENIRCNDGVCSAGWEKTKSYTLSASVDGGHNWITGGFNVQWSWSTGYQYTCYGANWETVCTWYETPHTAYNARTRVGYACGGYSYLEPGERRITSPNRHNPFGVYCVRGAGFCKVQGHQYKEFKKWGSEPVWPQRES